MLDVEISPSSISFGEVTIGSTAVQKAKLHATDSTKKIESVKLDDPRFTAKLIPGDTPNDAEVEVTFLGSKTQEHIATDAKIVLAGNEPSETSMPLRVRVVGNLRYPRQIFLLKKEDSFNTRDINLVSRSGKPFKIKDATDSAGLLKFDFPKTSGTEARITASVRNPKTEVDKSIRGTIKVQTTDALDSTIEIGYTLSNRRNSANIRDQVARARNKGTALPLLKAAQGADKKKSAPAQK